MAVAARSWTVGETTLSGIECRPAGSPLGTVVALHGGGYSAGYWHHRLVPEASLLELGAALGYRVLAVDRPGYGASHGLVGPAVRVARQAEIIAGLIEGLAAEPECGPVFLIGHSMGAILALQVAAGRPTAPAPTALAGVDISGLPYRFDGSPPTAGLPLDRLDFLPALSPGAARTMFYGPPETFAPAALEADAEIARPTPASEIIDALECGDATRVLAPSVRVPLQTTRAEFEASSGGGPEGLHECGALFSASPRVVAQVQVASGHNISLHRVARAYHQRAFAFFDEVRLARARPVSRRP
jgi:pimeloyl-ACP methyl ester carboxylesterase